MTTRSPNHPCGKKIQLVQKLIRMARTNALVIAAILVVVTILRAIARNMAMPIDDGTKRVRLRTQNVAREAEIVAIALVAAGAVAPAGNAVARVAASAARVGESVAPAGNDAAAPVFVASVVGVDASEAAADGSVAEVGSSGRAPAFAASQKQKLELEALREQKSPKHRRFGSSAPARAFAANVAGVRRRQRSLRKRSRP